MKDPVLQLLELRRRLISDRPWAALAFTVIGIMLLVTFGDRIALIVAILLFVAAAAVLAWHLLDRHASTAPSTATRGPARRLVSSINRFTARRGTTFAGMALLGLGLLLTAWMLVSAIGEIDGNSTLREHGSRVTSHVVSVEETNRSGESLTVTVQLPDGSRTGVDLSDSEHIGVEVGEPLQIVVDPLNLDLNSPDDALQNLPSAPVLILKECAPFALITIVGAIILLSQRRQDHVQHGSQAA